MMTSLIQTDPERGSFKTPLFHTFKMFSNNCLGYSIDTYVECDTFNTERFRGIPYLDVTAVYAKESKSVFINVVNRHKGQTITAEIMSSSGEFAGKAEVSLVNREDLNEPFAYDKAAEYVPEQVGISTRGNEFTCSFPPHSITQIKVGMK